MNITRDELRAKIEALLDSHVTDVVRLRLGQPDDGGPVEAIHAHDTDIVADGIVELLVSLGNGELFIVPEEPPKEGPRTIGPVSHHYLNQPLNPGKGRHNERTES